MDLTRYSEIVQRFSTIRMLVAGDLMLDEYLWGKTTRISPEAPVMVVDVERESSVPGGAANVVNNLLALGAHVSVTGLVGCDRAGEALVDGLRASGADVAGVIVDQKRSTTRKTRVVAHNQQVLRVDREQREDISGQSEESLCASIERQSAFVDAIVVSDYNKGIVTRNVAERAVRSAGMRGIPLTANPKPRAARFLHGADLLSVNQLEAEMSLGDAHGSFDHSPEEAGSRLRDELRVKTLLVTRGAHGLAYWTEGGAHEHVPAHAVEVYDVAGAGDTVISTMSLCIAAGATLHEAAVIANHAAACVVRKLGVATVSPAELLSHWD